MYLFQDEYLFDLEKAVVVEVPQAVHATYIVSKPLDLGNSSRPPGTTCATTAITLQNHSLSSVALFTARTNPNGFENSKRVPEKRPIPAATDFLSHSRTSQAAVNVPFRKEQWLAQDLRGRTTTPRNR